MDPADGLLKQGAEGYQLTWMDAKVGDWVVTPRRGKAVEINALWYNALRLLAGWLQGRGATPRPGPWRRAANRARDSFNERFWYEKQAGTCTTWSTARRADDASCRPNQVFAISPAAPGPRRARWKAGGGHGREAAR